MDFTVDSERKRALVELLRRQASRDLLSFMTWTWTGGSAFLVGRHTRAICRRLTLAAEAFERGESTKLVITVPFRHGKSEMATAFAAYFLGRCAKYQPSVIEACYNKKLATRFSKKVRSLVSSQAFSALYPDVSIARGSNRSEEWSLSGSASTFSATGLISGSITGYGANLIIVDDYYSGYGDSRSKATEEAVINAFTSDIFTRQNAPACIVLVVATQWSTTDLIGAIEQGAKAGGRFDGFEVLRFPARLEGHWETLFPEMYSSQWYASQRLALGPRQSAALLDCSPVPFGGGRFKPHEQCVMHDTLELFPARKEVRAWDLASSSGERSGSDPDWTWGVRMCVTGSKELGYDIWITQALCMREEAPRRDAVIRATARADGPTVRQVVEAFGAYKDAYTGLKQALSGVCSVQKLNLSGDKTVKASVLEPLFDSHRIHIYRGGMTAEALDRWCVDFATFPDGKHDDAVDATALAFHALTDSTRSRILI